MVKKENKKIFIDNKEDICTTLGNKKFLCEINIDLDERKNHLSS